MNSSIAPAAAAPREAQALLHEQEQDVSMRSERTAAEIVMFGLLDEQHVQSNRVYNENLLAAQHSAYPTA